MIALLNLSEIMGFTVKGDGGLRKSDEGEQQYDREDNFLHLLIITHLTPLMPVPAIPG